jgi:predicted oxidoreductase
MSNLVITVQEENPSFLNDKDKIDLYKLLKKLDKASLEALENLVKIMETTQDEKLRAQVSKDIIRFKIDVAKEINTDQMQRLIAEIKLNRGPQGKLIPLEGASDTEDQIKRPIVDFSKVHSLE